MGDGTPLYISLFVILLFGIIMPSIINLVVDVQIDEVTGPATTIISIIDDGIGIPFVPFDGTIDIFGFLSQDMKDSLILWVSGFGYLPSELQLFSLIVVNIGFLVTIIKLLPTT